MKAMKLKVKYTRLGIIAEALLSYADMCGVMAQTPNRDFVENYQIRLSIATELYYDLKKQMDKRFPSETYKIPLELHHAIVLQTALLRFVGNTEDDFKRAAIDIVKNNLNAEIVNLSKTVSNSIKLIS
ncbi:MAG: hypothetical protein CL528_00435 [Aequorivita sp.]|jgi:hypothetical protein|nr:hypothetical protein [Aequorivita sp.]MBP40217.1 hypothetical protein [Aequorivita sp.]|tara:strand:+ start:2368 stop:2751 length:384 start_codon:yes stop_codon:yes gene_type:complete